KGEGRETGNDPVARLHPLPCAVIYMRFFRLFAVAAIEIKTRDDPANSLLDAVPRLENDPKPCTHFHRFWTGLRRPPHRLNFPKSCRQNHMRPMAIGQAEWVAVMDRVYRLFALRFFSGRISKTPGF